MEELKKLAQQKDIDGIINFVVNDKNENRKELIIKEFDKLIDVLFYDDDNEEEDLVNLLHFFRKKENWSNADKLKEFLEFILFKEYLNQEVSENYDALIKVLYLLPSLIRLDLDFFDLNHDDIIKLLLNIHPEKIQDLCLEGNNIEKLPAEFVKLTNLREVDLRSNQLKEFPYILPETITELNISNNVINQGLDDRMKKFKSLSHLEIQGNDIRDISSLSYLNNLQYLIVRDNKHISLDQPISHLDYIKLDSDQLHLLQNINSLDKISIHGHNQKVFLPDNFGELGLTEISFIGSELSFPSFLDKNETIKALTFISSEFNYKELNMFPKLKNLVIRNNSIEEINLKIDELDSLEELRINCPSLTSFPIESTRNSRLKKIVFFSSNFSKSTIKEIVSLKSQGINIIGF